MKIHFTPHHLVLTAAIHEYVETKLSHLEKLAGNNIMDAHVTLLHEETSTKKYVVKVHLSLPGPDIWAEDAEEDLYAAIDKVSDILTGQLRKYKTKTKERTKHISKLSKESIRRGYKRR